jgi:Flp pilus assembly protein CpaB
LELLQLRSSRYYLVAAAIAAALSALIVFAYLRGVTARVAQAGRLVELVVAARNLRGGEVLDSSSLQLVPFPDRYLLPGTYTELSRVSGRRLARPVRQGEPILESALLSSEGEEACESITPGFRAFPLPQEATNFPLSSLPPEGRVDIVFVEGDSARLGLENVKVLGMTATENSASSWESSSGSTPLPSGCLLLEVTPEEACLLATALKEGRVEVLLRSRED